MEITILAPAYNEEGVIKKFLDSVSHVLSENYTDWEIIIVNDGSTDKTEERINEFKNTYPDKIVCINHEINKGLGAGLETGFKYARGDVVVTMDADCTHDAALIPKFSKEISNEVGLIIGSRYVDGGGMEDVPWYRVLYSKLGNLFFRLAFGLNVKDISSGFRFYRKDIAKKLVNLSSGFEVQVDILTRVKKETVIIERPFVLVDRQIGVSKMQYGQLLKAYFKLMLR